MLSINKKDNAVKFIPSELLSDEPPKDKFTPSKTNYSVAAEPGVVVAGAPRCKLRAEAANQRAEAERQRADAANQRAEAAEAELALLRSQIEELGN